MPTGFLPNPVSTTRKPSRQTRWKKTSFALVRLRTELGVCRRASYRIPSHQPDDHRVKPDGEISFALARLRPSSDHTDGLLTESRLDSPKAIGSNPMEENRLRPRSVETELGVCRRASYRIPSRQPEGHRVEPDGRKPASPSFG